MGRTKSYEGDGIVIHFDARRCIHAAECVGGLPAVFDANRRPWIEAGNAPADDIAGVVARCPSGALTYSRSDGGAEEVVAETPSVRTVPDGPLYVQGPVDVLDHDGSPIDVGPRVALCRCGASKNKPFCDNSHVEAGFVAS